MHDITLSVIIPAFNEQERIGTTLSHLAQYCKRWPYTYEIIVVDDGSTDSTGDVARSHAALFSTFIIIKNDINRGKGFSVQRGMLAAQGQYRLFMDADGAVDVAHLDSFLPWIRDGKHDIVIGSIQIDQAQVTEHNGSHRRILGTIAKILINTLVLPDIADTQRGFKLFSAEAAQAIFAKQTIDGFGFDIELLVIAKINGLTIKELPVIWNNPAGSKVTWWSYLRSLLDLLHIIRNRLSGTYVIIPTTKTEEHATPVTPLL